MEYLSSAALGKLITMEKKVKAAKGKLRLCCIRPEIYEVFAITKLNRLFKIARIRSGLWKVFDGVHFSAMAWIEEFEHPHPQFHD